MAQVMMTVALDPKAASMDAVANRLGLGKDDIDQDFGVVNIDPQRHLYAILVDDHVATKLADHPDVSGPYANPAIETFGPPKSKS